MSRKYTILFHPVDAAGHVNACIGVALQLCDRGHTVVFTTPLGWKGKLEAFGFKEELYRVSDEDQRVDGGGEKWGEMLAETGVSAISLPTIQMHEAYLIKVLKEQIRQIKYSDSRLRQIVASVKPDVIVIDFLAHIPALMDQGIPWINASSNNPLHNIPGPGIPPAFSGYSTKSDKADWVKYEETVARIYKHDMQEFAQWVHQNGGPPNTMKNFPYSTSTSPYANMYMFPLELDYTPIRPNPPNFYQFDGFVRQSKELFEIPAKLKEGYGKLVYFSMGTIGSAEVSMMKRLIAIFAKSPNRFIVSKGQFGDSLELAENMWGANYLPQTAVIPLVDLIITHGGNNTITESFYYGKRVLVLPLLFDQPDNGQRVQETGLGLQCHPMRASEREILAAIQTLLDNEMLVKRMKTIGNRIRTSNSQGRAADLVERVARIHSTGPCL